MTSWQTHCIVATPVVLHASVEAGVGTGLGALLFIGLATAVMRDALIEQFVRPGGSPVGRVLADRPAALPQQPAAARRLAELVDKLH